MQVGQVQIDELSEGFTIALACSRDEIQRVPPSCSTVQTSETPVSFDGVRRLPSRSCGIAVQTAILRVSLTRVHR
jgi:hypothetical protein